MMKAIIYQFGLLILLVTPVVLDLQAQETGAVNGRRFDVFLWPERGGLIDWVTAPEILEERLAGSWFQALMQTYLHRDVQFHFPKDDTLDTYKELILSTKPSCVEGDPQFIEEEINRNQADGDYIPLLRVLLEDKNPKPMRGMIVYPAKDEPWKGVLGVVHPSLYLSGGIQIEYWRKQTGGTVDWVSFYSTQELLFHLFAGTIQAAAVPEGILDQFLFDQGREDLISSVRRIPVPAKRNSYTVLFLHREIYNDPLQRVLISETWLRDHFPDLFQPIPAVALGE